jgi:hypothetical protein
LPSEVSPLFTRVDAIAIVTRHDVLRCRAIRAASACGEGDAAQRDNRADDEVIDTYWNFSFGGTV